MAEIIKLNSLHNILHSLSFCLILFTGQNIEIPNPFEMLFDGLKKFELPALPTFDSIGKYSQNMTSR